MNGNGADPTFRYPVNSYQNVYKVLIYFFAVVSPIRTGLVSDTGVL